MAATYSETCKEAQGKNEKNDCAVKALAIHLNIPYQKAWEALRDAGRKTRRGTKDPVLQEALETLRPDLKIEKYYVQGERKSELPTKETVGEIKDNYPPLYKTQNFTIKHLEWFPEAYSHIDNALIFVNRHVLCFKDGKVEDWSKGRRKWVKQIWITRPKTEAELAAEKMEAA